MKFKIIYKILKFKIKTNKMKIINPKLIKLHIKLLIPKKNLKAQKIKPIIKKIIINKKIKYNLNYLIKLLVQSNFKTKYKA